MTGSKEAHGEFYVLCVPHGFEEVVVRHVAGMSGASEADILTGGAVELRYTGPLVRLESLRAAEGLFRKLGVFLSSRNLDETMQNLVSQVDFKGWNGRRGAEGQESGRRFSLSIDLDPALGIDYHDFRSEVTWALQAILRAKPTPEGRPIHVAVGTEGGWVGVGCSERRPSEKGRPTPMGLTSAVAAGLVLSAGARPDDRFLDPLCGFGMPLLERDLAGPATALLGGDVDAEAVRAARTRLRDSLTPACICRWDPRRLPLKPNSIDAVVSSLPSGPQAGSHQIARSLYQSLLREVVRLLRPTGRAVLLTAEKKLLADLLGRQPELAVEVQHSVRTGRFRAELFAVRPVLRLL